MINGNIYYNDITRNDITDNDITYFDNIIDETSNTLFNILRILPNYSLENNIINQSLYDKPKYKKVISKNIIDKILVTTKYDISNNELNSSCPIFHLDFNNGDDITKLPCKHCFIPDAIRKWLEEEKNECPVCRYEFEYDEIVNKEVVINIEDEESRISNDLANSLTRSYSLPQNDNNWNTHASIVRPHNISLIGAIMNELIDRENELEFQEALFNSLE